MHVSTQRCIVPGQEKHPAITVGGDAYSPWGDGPCGQPHAKGIRSDCGEEMSSGGQEADRGTAYFSYVNGHLAPTRT